MMLFDNGLTPEQQADVDAKYEELMGQVKKIDPKLYRRLRANELPGFISDTNFQTNNDNQLEMNL